MPYKSKAQQGFFNSPTGKAKIGAAEVDKWNQESKGQHGLPDKVGEAGTRKAGDVIKRSFQSLMKRRK